MIAESNLGDNLIYLLSQEKSGSTLLQRVLGCHSEIHASGEPWLMLKPLFGMRHTELPNTYDAPGAQRALVIFSSTLPHGDDEYFEGVRRMYAHLYDCAIKSAGKHYFLDKTPEYFFIIPELQRTFPNAKYIFLRRNPLAILCSVLTGWIKQDWLSLNTFQHRLVDAPRWMLEAAQSFGDNKLIVHYEKFVAKPEAEAQRICDWLGLDFEPGMLEYGTQPIPETFLGDRKSYLYSRPHVQSVDKWRESLQEPQIWRVADDYLDLLGRETVTELGYSFDELKEVLSASRPGTLALRLTFSMRWLMEKPAAERPVWVRLGARGLTSLRHRGFSKTLSLAARRGTNDLLKKSYTPGT